MKKSCGLLLLVWAVLAGAYGYVAWSKVHELLPSAMIGVLGGTFAGVLVSSFIGLFTGGSDRAALKRALAGEAPADGRLEAASGKIRPLGAPLYGPFTGRPCVAYEYDVKNPDGGRSDFAGVGLTPCEVGSPRGPARLLGWAVLDQFGGASPGEIDAQRGISHLKASHLEPLGLTTMISVLGELMADDDGTIRKDFRVEDSDPEAVANRPIEEKIVPVGATVTVLGRWSTAKGGFVPGSGMMNRIFPGDLPTTLKKVGGSSLATFGIGVFFFLALHAILVPMYFLASKNAPKRDSRGEVLPKNLSVWDERDCDRQKELLALGANPSEKGRDGVTPLMNAAREGTVPCVMNLIAAGARLEDADRRGDTALAQAVVANREDTAGVLRRAGAKDFRVTAANGRPMTEDAEPFTTVKEYLAALFRPDFPEMARLKPGGSVKLMEERREDLPLWQSLRPREPRLVEGFMTDDAATLTVRGPSPKGDLVVSYHLQKTLEGWRIFREWFPEPR